MKFAAAAITPGRANSCQNGTEPSPKSIQSVPLAGDAARACVGPVWTAANAAQAASAMRSSFFTTRRLRK